jgi:AcrR family transcriptional regulator
MNCKFGPESMKAKKTESKQSTKKPSRKGKSSTSHQRELSPFSQGKRDQIVNAALETFLEYGYEGSSMSLIAQRANVIKQTIYSHFHDKESLFRVVIEKLTINHFKDAIDQDHFAGLSAPLGLRAIAGIIAARQSDPSYVELMRTIIGESNRFPELAHLYVDSVIKPGLSYVTEFLKAHPEPRIKDPEAFARVFCGSIVNYCMVHNILYGKQSLPFEFNRIIDTLLALAFQ